MILYRCHQKCSKQKFKAWPDVRIEEEVIWPWQERELRDSVDSSHLYDYETVRALLKGVSGADKR